MRVVITAGREAARNAADTSLHRIEASAYRAIATALIDGNAGNEFDEACDAFAADSHGVQRFEAMSQRAMQAGDGSHVPELFAALAQALGRRVRRLSELQERVNTALTRLAASVDYDVACASVVDGAREIVGMPTAALFVPGVEGARFVRAAATEDTFEHPISIRVDRGLFADVLAGTRIAHALSDVAAEMYDMSPGVSSIVVAALRDDIGKPLGILVIAEPVSSREPREPSAETIDAVQQFIHVVQGTLSVALESRRDHAALAALPQLATIAHDTSAPFIRQLEGLAQIAVEATESDAAIIRLRTVDGRGLETVAAWARADELVADIIGSKTMAGEASSEVEWGDGEHQLVEVVDSAEGWSAAASRILRNFSVRSLASYPITSVNGHGGVLWILRHTNRTFDDTDNSCGRIVSSHLQHVVDRRLANAQTQQAVAAAQSAIRLLGEALVAGIRTERTLRFVPRLFHEMFECHGCRVWRIDADGSRSVLSGSGRTESDVSDDLLQSAIHKPLVLSGPVADALSTLAISFDEYHGTKVVIELELEESRALGEQERGLVLDVTERVSEALYSAEQAASQQRQLERVRVLQNVIARAHERLSEAHVIATVVEDVAHEYSANGAGVFVVSEDGRLESRAAVGLPSDLVQAIEQARHWVPDAGGDDRASVIIVRSLGDADAVRSLKPVIDAGGLSEAAAVYIPLTARDQTIGCLMLLFADGHPAAIGSDSGTLKSFGEHIGVALLNAREHERERQLRQRTSDALDVERENSRQVRALHEVSRTFATSLSLDETMRAVVESMADRLDVDAVWIRTPDDRGDKMLLRAFYASHPELSSALERMVQPAQHRDEPITHRVINTRQPVLIVGAVDEMHEYASDQTLVRLKPFLHRGSTVCVLPVATPNEVLGTLTMLSIDPEHALTNEKVDVASGVTSQAALALDNARLYQQQKHFADVIQESLLPSRLPQIPEIDLGVLYRSATGGGAEVGGDFYDFLQLDDGRLALIVGDVCGKGVAAAADTAMTKYIFRALAREHPSPSSFLRYANEVVCEEITPGKFVTVFYAVIDSRAGTVTCGKAGHPEPKLVYSNDGADPTIVSVGPEGLALGIMPDQDYEQVVHPFEVGTSLVVYTDGVVEARRNTKLYGQYRLERRLIEEGTASAPQIAFAIYQDCAAYAEDGLGDDVAIVVAQRVNADVEIEEVFDGE